MVVLSFVGNAITPCITGGGEPTARQIAQRYARAARRAVTVARAGAARVILVAPPHMRTPDREVVAQAITRQWRRIDREADDVTVVDAAARLSPGGYTDTLTCRDYETAGEEVAEVPVGECPQRSRQCRGLTAAGLDLGHRRNRRIQLGRPSTASSRRSPCTLCTLRTRRTLHPPTSTSRRHGR